MRYDRIEERNKRVLRYNNSAKQMGVYILSSVFTEKKRVQGYRRIQNWFTFQNNFFPSLYLSLSFCFVCESILFIQSVMIGNR